MKSKKPLINHVISDSDKQVGIVRISIVQPKVEVEGSLSPKDIKSITPKNAPYSDMVDKRVAYSHKRKYEEWAMGRVEPTNIISAGSDLDSIIEAGWSKLPVKGVPLKYQQNKRGDILLRSNWDIRIRQALLDAGVLKNQQFIDTETGRTIKFQKIFRKDMRKFFKICNMSKQPVHRVGENEPCIPSEVGTVYE